MKINIERKFGLEEQEIHSLRVWEGTHGVYEHGTMSLRMSLCGGLEKKRVED